MNRFSKIASLVGAYAKNRWAMRASRMRPHSPELVSELFDAAVADTKKAWGDGGITEMASARQTERVQKSVESVLQASRLADPAALSTACGAFAQLMSEIAGPIKQPRIQDAMNDKAVAHAKLATILIKMVATDAPASPDLALSASQFLDQSMVKLRAWVQHGYWVPASVAVSDAARIPGDESLDWSPGGSGWLCAVARVASPASTALRVACLVSDISQRDRSPAAIVQQLVARDAQFVRLALVSAMVPALELAKLALQGDGTGVAVDSASGPKDTARATGRSV